jgi:hypothetical protein
MSNLHYFYNHWDYWNLRHKVTFDGINKLILINNGEVQLDVQQDLYSDWKEWVRLESNLKYLPPFNTVGGEPTVAGQRLDVTYFLINGWKLKPYQGTYDLNLVGNIFDVDGGTIKVPADININNPNNITINTNTSVIVRQVDSGVAASGSGGLTDDESTALFNIEGKVVSIYGGATPVSASLEQEQLTTLNDISAKVAEIWKLHGLDVTNPLTVTRTSRTFDDIVQSISTIGTGSAQETTITRL